MAAGFDRVPFGFAAETPALMTKTWTYTYDTSGRLASASDGGAPVTYTYDTNGNRLTGNPDAQDRVLSQGGTTYTYDNHGNVTTRTVSPQPTQTLTWNGQGGLLSVAQSGSSTVTYVIDPQGRRVGRKVGANLDREWLYDTQLRLVGEVIGTTTRVYGYLPERHLPVMMRETKSGNTTTYRIYGDHLGSLRAVVKSADGTPVQLMQHDAWGNVLIDTVAAGFDRVPFGFAGGQYDENTKLVRFGAREYDATTGRWLSKDEARFGGGWNFYEYAGSDPVNRVDPSGRSWRDFFDWFGGGGPGGGGQSGGGGSTGAYGGGDGPCEVTPKKQCPYSRSEFKGDPDRTICYYACADGTSCSKTYMGYATCPSWSECGGDGPN